MELQSTERVEGVCYLSLVAVYCRLVHPFSGSVVLVVGLLRITGVARAVSATGKSLWNLNLGLFASTMGAITSDGAHVLLANSSGLSKVEVATGRTIWSSDHESRIEAAGLVIDATGASHLTVSQHMAPF